MIVLLTARAHNRLTSMPKRNRSVEEAFLHADTLAARDGLKACINRRGLLAKTGQLKVESLVWGSYTLVIDLTAIRDTIKNLSTSEEGFLNAICTTLRSHYVMIARPMERIAIPFGEFIGIFSWQNQADAIVCHRVFSVSPDVPDDAFTEVMYLSLRYNSLAASRYRYELQKEYAGMESKLKNALDRFHDTLVECLTENTALRMLAPVPYKVAAGLFAANVREADAAWAQDDFAQCIINLETALTAMHNLCLQLVEKIAVK